MGRKHDARRLTAYCIRCESALIACHEMTFGLVVVSAVAVNDDAAAAAADDDDVRMLDRAPHRIRAYANRASCGEL